MRWWLLLVLVGCGDNLDGSCRSWFQWGGNPAHDNQSCVRGQALTSVLADIVIDPFVPMEVADAGGNLSLHYQSPLLTQNLLFTMMKGGTYTPCRHTTNGEECDTFRLESQVWSEAAYRIVERTGEIQPLWTFETDWKPVPGQGFEPMFQAALSGAHVVVPAANGGVQVLDQQTGAMVAHYAPFDHEPVRQGVRVAGGIAISPDGTMYYDTIQIAPDGSRTGSWLVAIAPDDTETIVDYATLVPAAPAATDKCVNEYIETVDLRPWPLQNPDGSTKLPRAFACGAQQAGINLTPSIGADGTVFVATHAGFNESYAYVVALAPDLSLRWATSLRDHLHDGCGSLVAPSAAECPPGTPPGLDPNTGQLPAGAVSDNSSASPVALPDGGVLYGAYSHYNGYRGHMFRFDASGAILGTYDFGWDTTPSVIGTGPDFKIVTKDNHYGQDANGVDLGPYYITELDAAMHVAWQAKSTNTQSCSRAVDGTVACTDDHPNGFEWCVNAVAVDRDGTIFANSEDGTAYSFNADGTPRDSIFLDEALGAAYTPVALDPSGRVFTLNSGHLAELGHP